MDTNEIREGLNQELTYLRDACRFVALPSDMSKFDFIGFHWNCREKRPFCYKASKIVAVTQPTSAAVERVFSLLRNIFGKQQHSTKSDKKNMFLHYRYIKRSKNDISF